MFLTTEEVSQGTLSQVAKVTQARGNFGQIVYFVQQQLTVD